jgi:DNA replication protein DnaC
MLHPENTTSSRTLAKATTPKRTVQPEVARSWEEATPSFREAFRACANGEEPWPLFVYGDAGAGKTLGALAACDHVVGVAKFTTLYDLHLDAVALAKGELFNSLGYETFPRDYWRGWERAALAVLDELGGREKVSDTAYEAVWRLLEARKGRKPLVVISNLDPKRISVAFDDRIASRCCEGTVVKLTGDRRLVR